MAKFPKSLTIRMGEGLYHQIQAVEKNNDYDLNQSQVIRALLHSAVRDYQHDTIEDIDLKAITDEIE